MVIISNEELIGNSTIYLQKVVLSKLLKDKFKGAPFDDGVNVYLAPAVFSKGQFS